MHPPAPAPATPDPAVATPPADFPDRGAQVTRIEAFVDAAFAFALTMLAISVGSVPGSMPELFEALKATPAFAASFAQVAMFWYAHVRWSRRYGLDDFPSTIISLVLVFLVMVYVYPLKALFATFFGWISRGWLPFGFEIHSLRDLSLMFVVYGLVFATMGATVSLLYLQAWRKRVALGLSLEEQVETAQRVAQWLVLPVVGAASIAAALALSPGVPGWMLSLPGVMYFLMILSWPVTGFVGRRVRARLQGA
jgi:uncharacterized membrane protein